MKILFFIESLHSGGKERRLVELIKGLIDYPDIECELVLTRKEIHYKDIFSTGIKIHTIERKFIKKDPRLFFLFYKICKKYKPDIVHVWGNLPAIYAIPAKVLLGFKMINSQITDAPVKAPGGLLSHKITFPFSDLIIANSYAGLKSYSAPTSKSMVIYNGFNFNRIDNLIDQQQIKRKFIITTPSVVGMVGQFHNRKDYFTFLEAAKIIINNRNDVSFMGVGSGHNLNKCKDIAGRNNNRIIFTGRQEDIESIINIFNIGVLITNDKVHGEGISNALMEYMALGKPVIASRGGGTQEIVTDNKTGFIIDPKNPEQLAEKINLLLDNNTLANEMGRMSKKRIENDFNISKMTSAYIHLYQSQI